MRESKKGELQELIVWIFLTIGIVIISVWYISFISEQTIQEQNLIFNSLNRFSEYYKLTCSFDNADIRGVRIEAVEQTIITVKNKEACIESENFLKTCTKLICDYNDQDRRFVLDNDVNYFVFEKTTNEDTGTITMNIDIIS